VDGNQFYESSGLYGKSLLVSYPVAELQGSTWAKISAPFTRKTALPPQYFAEGLTLLNNKLYLLTWKEQTLLVYDKTNFTLQQQFSYQGEGWGLTTDGKQLIRSDGSDRLFFHRAEDFSIARELHVTDDGKPVNQLNELEYAQGFIWANVWYQDRILKIDPANGKVLGELNLQALKQSLALTNSEQVLNGILWPRLFLLRIAQ
jgi:glutamine cyclotransferase